MARNPAKIINTLRAIDHPNDFFKIVGATTGIVLMPLPPDLNCDFDLLVGRGLLPFANFANPP